jgi:hypothetical protein
MAFVNEQISEIDQEGIDYSKLEHSNSRFGRIGTPWWTVDRGRNAFLIGMNASVPREDHILPAYFLFSLQGELITFAAIATKKPSDDPMLGILVWEVVRLHLPETLQTTRDQIIQILTEALLVYGRGGTQSAYLNINSVEVDFLKHNNGTK